MSLRRNALILCAASAAFAGPVAAGTVHMIDFETEDDFLTPLVNGQAVASPDEFGTLFNLSSSGNNQGAAIFDSNPNGPNQGGGDGDLLVGLGNVLMLQSNDDPAITNGIFDNPNDSAQGGTITFEFLAQTQLVAMDLIDIDGSVTVDILITDGNGLTRTFFVDSNWTFDIEQSGPNGYDTLDLMNLGPQQGEAGGFANGFEDAGFDASDVVSMDVTFNGSAALDNLAFVTVPAPGVGALLLGALLTGSSRRRKA